jgi:uncharacterized protein
MTPIVEADGLQVSVEREEVRFSSGDTECAAWHYPGTNGACVIMAGGFAVTKGPGTDLFAGRFNAAGFTVLAFDYRHLGDSGGQPRQVQRIREQIADWQAAIAFAPTLPGVDPTRVAVWGFSLSGGHVLRTDRQLARDRRVGRARERRRLLVPHVLPRQVPVAAQRIGEPVQ